MTGTSNAERRSGGDIGPEEMGQALKHWRAFGDYIVGRRTDALAAELASGRLSREEANQLITEGESKAWEAMRDGVGLSPDAHSVFSFGARELLRRIATIEGGEELTVNQLVMIAFIGLAVGLKARQLADEKE